MAGQNGGGGGGTNARAREGGKAAVEVASHILPARGFITGNPTILEINDRAAVDPDEVVAAATVALERAFGPAPANLDFQATVFLGTKPDS